MEKIFDAVREPLLVLDPELRIRSANAAFYGVFNLAPIDAEERLIYELGNGEWDVPELREGLPRIFSTNRPLERLEVERDFIGLGRRTMLLNARRLEGTDLILIGIEDITGRKHWEERQKLLVAELSHRVKNLLTTVHSIASQTARHAESISSFTETFNGRLQALGRAHALLTASNWVGARVGEVVSQALQPYGAARERIRAEGDDFDLEPPAALVLSMIVYELATNAAKHGALSSPYGRLEVEWQLIRAELGPALHLTWQERGGPPVTPPRRAGFGRSLIEHSLAYELEGDARLEFVESGLRCQILIPYNPSNFRAG